MAPLLHVFFSVIESPHSVYTATDTNKLFAPPQSVDGVPFIAKAVDMVTRFHTSPQLHCLLVLGRDPSVLPVRSSQRRQTKEQASVLNSTGCTTSPQCSETGNKLRTLEHREQRAAHRLQGLNVVRTDAEACQDLAVHVGEGARDHHLCHTQHRQGKLEANQPMDICRASTVQGAVLTPTRGSKRAWTPRHGARERSAIVGAPVQCTQTHLTLDPRPDLLQQCLWNCGCSQINEGGGGDTLVRAEYLS
jgi:hypothetical protein